MQFFALQISTEMYSMESKSRRARRAEVRAPTGNLKMRTMMMMTTQAAVRKSTHRLVPRDVPTRHTTQQVDVVKRLRQARRC